MNAHTPGPWHVRHLFGRDEFGVFWTDPSFADKRQFRVDNRCGEFKEADARLIAASPDMLAALQNLENDDGSIPSHAWEMVQKAIAKATGGQA